MQPQQMAMPAGMAAQGPSPEETAIYEQMRQEISPQEFSNEMLAGASQVDPQAVAEFTQELQGLDMPPEALDALNDVVDEILANPEQYDEMRSEYVAAGLPDEILPEQFDPQFFAALNMAIDQMIAAPTGVQAFAKGGIAELKPIAKAIASYGRNGDTMLAHITPAEARMLRRRGGSGTINPDTGLPEFFSLKKVWKKTVGKVFEAVGDSLKSIGKAVKKFASSKIGRLVTTVALGFFLGPAAASLMGVGSVAGVAAVSGFVGSAGSTLLAGGNLKDALKAGAIGGLTAGAGAGLMGGADAFASGSYTGPTTIGGQFDSFKGMLPGSAPVVDAPAAAPVPTGDVTAGIGANQMPTPSAGVESGFGLENMDVGGGQGFVPPAATATGGVDALYDPATATRAVDFGYKPGGQGGTPAYKPPTIGESFSKMGQGLGMGEAPASFDTFKQGASDLFAPGGPSSEQVNARAAELVGKTPKLPFDTAIKQATAELAPGFLRTYGPAAAAGLGIMGLSGGFQTKQPQLSPTAQALLDRDKNRPTIENQPDQFYVQGLKGVKYDDRGAIIGSQPYTPTATMDDIRVPAKSLLGDTSSGLGSIGLPPLYSSAPGAMGAAQVAQPYNTPSMYANLMSPPRFADGGGVNYPMSGLASLAQGGYPRRTGQISGPGTDKSDSIPAMLSDGEFVMTAKAVRGAGKGSRRAGAKKMYDLMHQLERNASRG